MLINKILDDFLLAQDHDHKIFINGSEWPSWKMDKWNDGSYSLNGKPGKFITRISNITIDNIEKIEISKRDVSKIFINLAT